MTSGVAFNSGLHSLLGCPLVPCRQWRPRVPDFSRSLMPRQLSRVSAASFVPPLLTISASLRSRGKRPLAARGRGWGLSTHERTCVRRATGASSPRPAGSCAPAALTPPDRAMGITQCGPSPGESDDSARASRLTHEASGVFQASGVAVGLARCWLSDHLVSSSARRPSRHWPPGPGVASVRPPALRSSSPAPAPASSWRACRELPGTFPGRLPQ